MTEEISLALRDLKLAPRRKGFRVAPPSWRGHAHAEAPVFRIDANQLWRAWIDFATSRPRTAR